MTCFSLEISVPELEGDSIQGKSVGYIFLGSSPAGIFSLSDVCRTGVKDAMRELKQMGIKTVMLTGDCYAAANHVQDQVYLIENLKVLLVYTNELSRNVFAVRWSFG